MSRPHSLPLVATGVALQALAAPAFGHAGHDVAAFHLHELEWLCLILVPVAAWLAVRTGRDRR